MFTIAWRLTEEEKKLKTQVASAHNISYLYPEEVSGQKALTAGDSQTPVKFLLRPLKCWEKYCCRFLLTVWVNFMTLPLILDTFYIILSQWTKNNDWTFSIFFFSIYLFHNEILWFLRNMYLVIQITEIYFSYIFGFHLWFLVHRP